jgi:hypothetical protein
VGGGDQLWSEILNTARMRTSGSRRVSGTRDGKRGIARRFLALWGCGVVLLAASTPGAGAQVTWDEAFPTTSAPPNVYFQARYRDARGERHRLQVWREANARLRRKTDEVIDVSVERDLSGRYVYRLADRGTNTVVAADRSILSRAGLFLDWRGLAHVLDVPRGSYRIARIAVAPQETAHGPCVWFRVETTQPSPAVSDICWSGRWGLPLIIRAPGAGEMDHFRIEEVRTFVPDASTFAVSTEGLVRIDSGPDETPLD